MKTSLSIPTYDSTTGEYGRREFSDVSEKLEFINSIYRLPGECKLDARFQIARMQAEKFDRSGVYTDAFEGTYDFYNYWDTQKDFCLNGLIIDDEFYVTEDYYWYLNFIKIPDKVKNDFAFPRIQDLDYWTFICIQRSICQDEFLGIVKARQTGFSLKFLARMLRRVWFERQYMGKVAAFDDKYVDAAWQEILTPYRAHLNEHTAWYRAFEPSDKHKNWKQGYKVNTKDGRDVFKGNLSTLKGVTTKVKASAVVSGTTSEVLYDEAGVSLNVDKVMQLIKPALKFGDILTGNAWVLGAAGEMKEAEKLATIIYNPRANNISQFPNIWSGKPDQMVGMFVPYYYSYGSCIDQWGNSLIELAKQKYQEELVAAESLSFKEAALFKAQYPATLEDAFSVQEENIFDVEAAKRQYDYLEQTYSSVCVELYDDATKPTGVSHRFLRNAPLVTDFPIKKGNNDYSGALVVDEFPPLSPPPGLYYVVVDPIRPVQTDTSYSLHSIYVYKARHRIESEFSEDRMVAWYCGRHRNPEKTYKLTMDVIRWYNARAAIESDQASCIEYMIGKKMQKHLMKRSDMPILKDWVPSSQIHEEYGFRTGSGNSAIREHFFSLIIEYCREEIGTVFDDVTGEPRTVYGIERIRDKMLLVEMMKYRKGVNVDRLIAFGAALMVAASNANRGIMAVKKVQTENEIPKPIIQNKASLAGGSRHGLQIKRNTQGKKEERGRFPFGRQIYPDP